MTQTRVRLWNVDEYHQMLETGIITADERVELIDGQVYLHECQKSSTRSNNAVCI
ncbi:MAG: hypothetical protein V7K57_00090 [Nostoc sp.]|uniref:hypothetical protein n=1 Tax=Nostoc sp. TaxID=1180 RepID=UPI002FFB1A45